ncbi:MAG: hypothetical protein QE283_09515 [Rhodoferax sp.]|nr:hypothetical protein [Rhodoferax sp.]
MKKIAFSQLKSRKINEKRYKIKLESNLYTTFTPCFWSFPGILYRFLLRNLQGYKAGFSGLNSSLLAARCWFGAGSSSLQLAGFSS